MSNERKGAAWASRRIGNAHAAADSARKIDDDLLAGAKAHSIEADRIFALLATRLVNSARSEDFDRITRLAAQFFGVPTALVSLVTADKQWFKSRVGMEVEETERDVAFCNFTIRQKAVMVVEDATKDARFKTNRLVTGAPGIRFYAGAPLITSAGHALGSICLIDYAPRSFTPAQCRQLTDMAKLVMAQIDLFQLAGRIHAVTQLPNRAQFVIDMEDLVVAGDAGQHTLVMVDIMRHSHRQRAVIALGIESVDSDVRLVATRFGEVLGGRSPLYHLSDTRFAFVLRGPDTAQHAAEVDQILAALGKPIRSQEMAIELDLVCGAVEIQLATDDVNDALRKCASALHEAEHRQLPFLMHSACFDVRHRRTHAMLQALPRALADGELRLVYQPKLDVVLGRFTAVEALVRWHSNVWGSVSPAEFIPVIENTSIIHLFTEWVLHTALAQAAAWQAQGLYMSVAINVSAKNLEHPQFVRQVHNACVLHGVAPMYLHVECTENAVLTGERSLKVLTELRQWGVQTSLDDFGLGYSNLACLQSLPVGLIKIDQSLVKSIVDNVKAWTLLQSLISLGHTLGYRVLAEGVETAEIYEMLLTSGCDGMQGYFLSRPIEVSAVLDFMRGQHRSLPCRSDRQDVLTLSAVR